MLHLLSLKKSLKNGYSPVATHLAALIILGLVTTSTGYAAKKSSSDSPQDCDFQFISGTTITFGDNAYKVGLIRHEGAEWEYGVCELSGKSLSHWTLGLSNCVTTSDSIESYSPMAGDDIEGVETGQDPKTGVTGIKWDLKDGFSKGTFTITLDSPNYVEGEITVAAKAGNDFGTGTIIGPDCLNTSFFCNDIGMNVDLFGVYDGEEVTEGSQLRIGTNIEVLFSPYSSVLFELIQSDGTIIETYEDTDFPYYFLGEETQNGQIVPINWDTTGLLGNYTIRASIYEAGVNNGLCYQEVSFKLSSQPICDTLYGVHDKGLNDTLFFTVDILNSFQINQLGPEYPDHDIEGLAIASDGTMYASSGDNNSDSFDRTVTDPPKGHLYQVDRSNGDLTRIGSIVHDQNGESVFKDPVTNVKREEVSALAINPTDDSLWGWIKKFGLVKINPTGIEPLGVIEYQSSLPIEEITWNLNGDILYASYHTTRYKFSYNQNRNPTIILEETKDDCFPSQVEGMAIIQGGSLQGKLLLGFHEYGNVILQGYDPESCQFDNSVTSFSVEPFSDVEGISWYCANN